jgi:N-methylhydantoinase B
MASRLSDPIGFELFKNTMLSIADEMALTILRTAYSGVLKDNMDYSTALSDAEGRTVAQGLTLPGHLSSFPDALAATLRRFGDRMRPGDVYALNDPFEGMHLPDVFILSRSSTRAAAWPSRHHLPPDRHGRAAGRLQRLRLDGDLPGGAAHPAGEDVRRR